MTSMTDVDYVRLATDIETKRNAITRALVDLRTEQALLKQEKRQLADEWECLRQQQDFFLKLSTQSPRPTTY